LADLPTDLFDYIQERSKGGVIRRTNPIDLGDVFDESFYLEVLDRVLGEPEVDGAAFFFDYELNDFRAFEIVRGVERLCAVHKKPVILCMVPDRKNWFDVRYATDMPFFVEPERGFAALRRSLDHFTRKRPTILALCFLTAVATGLLPLRQTPSMPLRHTPLSLLSRTPSTWWKPLESHCPLTQPREMRPKAKPPRER